MTRVKKAQVWNLSDALEQYEKIRDRMRAQGRRLSFDCFNLKAVGNRAVCSKGYLLGQANDGSLDLVTVLRGVTSGVCKGCSDFITEEEE